MVEFWGIFVVFSAYAAFQLTESRNLNIAHAPAALSSSQNLQDLSIIVEAKNSARFARHASTDATDADDDLHNSLEEHNSSDWEQYTDPPKNVKDSSEESDESAEIENETSAKSNKHLSLIERRNNLYYFSTEGISKYEKDFVRLTRANLKAILNELEALPKKSDDIEEKLKDIEEALKEIDEVDLAEEPTDFTTLENAMDTLVYLGLEPENNVPELEEVLEKTGWIDMRNELADELNKFIDEFGEKFDAFIATLTPWERLTYINLVDLNKRFAKADAEGKWHLLNQFWWQLAE